MSKPLTHRRKPSNPAIVEVGKDTQFKPGHSIRKPHGARQRLCGEFIKMLAADFEEHGVQAIVNAREADPVAYVRLIGSLVPKEFTLDRPFAELSDDDVNRAADIIRLALADTADSLGVRGEEAGGGKPSRDVSSVH